MLTESISAFGLFRPSCQFDDGIWTRSATGRSYTNHIHQAVLCGVEIPLPPFDGLSLMNNPQNSEAEKKIYYISDSPPTRDLAALYNSPYLRWSGKFNSIVSLFNGSWDFERGRCSVADENPVLHRNIVGTVLSGQTDDRRYWFYTDDEGNLTYHHDEHSKFKVVFINGNITVTPLLQVYSENRIYFLDQESEDYFNTVLFPTYESDQVALKNYFLNFRQFREADRTYFTYTWVVGRVVSGNWKWSIALMYYGFTPTYHQLAVADNQDYQLSQLITVSPLVGYKLTGPDFVTSGSAPLTRAQVRALLNTDQYIGIDPHTSQSFVQRATAVISEPPFFTTDPNLGSNVAELVGYDFSRARYFNTHSKSYWAFHKYFENEFPSFASGAFISSQDAIDTFIGGLSGNYIETISEIKDILKPLNVLKAVRALINKRGLGERGVNGLLKLLANADLSYRFGIAPMVSDAQDVARKAQRLLSRLSSDELYRPQTIYGSVAFENLSAMHEDFDPISVFIRSKVRLGFNIDSLLPFILPLEALGVLPSLSRVWDLIPYSWLADSLTQVGKSAEYLDTSLLHLLFDVSYSVHTVKVCYFFTEMDQSTFDFSSDSENPAGYQLFVRFALLKALPVIGPGTLPIFMPGQLPKWDILGSVLVGRA